MVLLYKGHRHQWLILVMYEFKMLIIGKITPKSLFVSAYMKEVYKQEQVLTSNKQLCVILDAKCEREDSNKLLKNQWKIKQECNVMNCLKYF